MIRYLLSNKKFWFIGILLGALIIGTTVNVASYFFQQAAKRSALTLYEKALTLSQQAQIGETIEETLQTIELLAQESLNDFPKEVSTLRLHLLLASMYQETQQRERAIETYQSIQVLSHGTVFHFPVLLHLSHLYLTEGNYDLTLQYLEEIVANRGLFLYEYYAPQAYLYLALVELEKGDQPSKAKSYLENLKELFPEHFYAKVAENQLLAMQVAQK